MEDLKRFDKALTTTGKVHASLIAEEERLKLLLNLDTFDEHQKRRLQKALDTVVDRRRQASEQQAEGSRLLAHAEAERVVRGVELRVATLFDSLPNLSKWINRLRREQT